MTNWMNRFAALAIAGSIVGSALVMGCGGDDTTTTNSTTTDANGATTETKTTEKED
ncbi:MAG TPA: hypothetical protein VF719_11115 [Abditibacteriaceae bacterium]|jgi:hypothetical protein